MNCSSSVFLDNSSLLACKESFPFFNWRRAFFWRTPRAALNSLSESLVAFFASWMG